MLDDIWDGTVGDSGVLHVVGYEGMLLDAGYTNVSGCLGDSIGNAGYSETYDSAE